MKLVKVILGHSFWMFLGNSFGRLAMFLTNIIAARILSQDVFGQFSMLRNTISTIESIVNGSFGPLMIKRVAEVESQGKERLHVVLISLFIANIVISIFLALILYLSTPFLVEHFFIGQIQLIQGMYISSVTLMTIILVNVVQNIMIGFEEYKRLAFASVIASFLSFPLIILLIFKYELYGALFGVTSYFLIDFILKYGQLRRINKIGMSSVSLKRIITEIKKLFFLSIPLLVAILISSFSFWYARVIVVDLTGGFNDIAIFDAAFQWLTIIMIITGATTNISLPMISKAISKNLDVSKIFYINLTINLIISTVMALFFIVFSKSIMGIYGMEYIEGYVVLDTLSIVSVFASLNSILHKYFISLNKTQYVIMATLSGSVGLFIYIKAYTDSASALSLSYAFLIFYLLSSLIYVVFYLNHREGKS